MISTLIIKPLPPTLNITIAHNRNSRWTAGESKTAETNRVDLECRAQVLPRYPGKVWLEFYWHVSNFGSDPDNISAAAKYVLDGLVQAEVLTKDSLMVIQNFYPHWFFRAKRGEEFLRLAIADFNMQPDVKPYCNKDIKP